MNLHKCDVWLSIWDVVQSIIKEITVKICSRKPNLKLKTLLNILVMFDGSTGRIYTVVMFDVLFETLFCLYLR